MALQKAYLGIIILILGHFSFITRAEKNVCKTFGNGVIQKFNGTMFPLKTTCPFTLTRFTLLGVNCDVSVQSDATGLMTKVEILVNKVTTIIQDGKVTVEGNSISLPYEHTYQQVYPYGIYIQLRSKVLPFSVTWRNHPGGVSSVWVQLDHSLVDGMTGMCGQLNDTETTGELISNNVIADGKCMTEDTKYAKPAAKECQVLSYATRCKSKPVGMDYFELCARTIKGNTNTHAKCAFFEEIAHRCGNQSPLWSKWRGETTCPPFICPGDLKFEELGLPFPPTCTNPQPLSEFFASTCLPPSGMVLNDRAEGYHCINVNDCPCVHGGKKYSAGTQRNSKCQSCVCVQGKWACSANTCPPTCNIEGKSVTTFDGKQYSVPGKCTYVAARGQSWTVAIKFSDTDASIAEMYLDVSQERYTFSSNSVKLGQNEITDLSQTDHTTVFWQSSMFVQVQTSFDMKIKVQVYPEIQIYLYLPPTEKTKGLCGTYNNDTEDDFTTSSGIVENAVLPFAQSWAVGDCSTDIPVCINTDYEIFAEDKCNQLRNASSLFARCHDYVPVSAYFEACVKRTCQCTSGLQSCLCVALSNYAKACASQGIDIGDWRAETACEITCNGNLKFSYTMRACNQTCRALTGPDPTCEVETDPVEGCGCLPGTHLNTPLECSSSALCMCHYQERTSPPGPVVIDGRQCMCENAVLRCSNACDCPPGKICVHCAEVAVSTAHRTCDSLSKPFEFLLITQSVDEICTTGCYCPEGLFEDHNGGCVTQDRCTCEFSGGVYESGQSVETNCKKCTCKGGLWHCEGEPCPGVCEVFGDGQYNTFDSKWYRFDGNCQYTLAEDARGYGQGLFAVRVESVPCCDEALTCSRSISVDLKDEVTLTLRDMNITETLKAGWFLQTQPLYSIHSVGLYIIISVPDLGLTVIWDKHTRVKIVLQARWKGNVQGLCGNFDGQVMNDMLTSSSSVVFSTLEFGNSWKTAVRPCSDVTQETFPCQRHSYCEAWAQRRCMILHSDTFTSCHLKVDPAPYYQACILESCSCEFEGRFLGFCTAVAAYAEACTNQNVCINWRTPDLCPVYCDYYNEESEYGWHYDPCGQIKTCGKKHSFTGRLEGCYPRCPAELPYFDENTRKCSSLDKCTCYFNNTVITPDDKVMTSSECCECTEGQLICEYCASTPQTPKTSTAASTTAPSPPETTPKESEPTTKSVTTPSPPETTLEESEPTTKRVTTPSPPKTTPEESEPTTEPVTTPSPPETTPEESEPTTKRVTTPSPPETTPEESEPTTEPVTTPSPPETTPEESEPTTEQVTTPSSPETTPEESEPTTEPVTTPSPPETTPEESEPTTEPVTTPSPPETTPEESEPTTEPVTTPSPPETTPEESEPTTEPVTTPSSPETTPEESEPTTEPVTTPSSPETTPEESEPTTEPVTTPSSPETTPEESEPTTELVTTPSPPETTPEESEPTTELVTTPSPPETTPEESEPTDEPVTTPSPPETTPEESEPTTEPETVSTVTTVYTPQTTFPIIVTAPPPTTISEGQNSEYTTMTSPTVRTTTYKTSIIPTEYTTIGFCRDPLRNQSWPSGYEWMDDCFYKTCRNSTIEMRPVICPTLVQPVCPRDLMRVVKDEQGCCEIWQCDCQCDLYGDPHYISFAGTEFNFLENCTYTLVKERIPRHEFSITVDNYFATPWLDGSWAKGIIMQYQDNTVTLQVNDEEFRVEATLNQMPVQPPYEEYGIRFEDTNYQVIVYIDEIRSHVSLDVERTLQINLAMEHFRDNTLGQCGVCGGASCVRRSGRAESEDCCDKTAYDWIEEDPMKPYCTDALRHVPCDNPNPTPTEPYCYAPHCDLLRHEVFHGCIENIDVERLVKNCRFDYCIGNGSICAPLQHLSEQCKRMGICVYWRHLTEGACDFNCPEGMMFDECRSMPDDVCQGRLRVPGKFSTDRMRSGCFCPNNMSLAEEHKTVCVSECTNCKGPLGEPMPPGATWESNCQECICNNQTLTTECLPKPPSPAPVCHADYTLVPDCCNNQICAKKTCEYKGKTYEVGDTWKDHSESCVSFSCTSSGIEVERHVCPEPSCSKEFRVWDEHHCCYTCNFTCAVRMSKMMINVENCTQEVALPSCEGYCPSGSMWVGSGEVQLLRQDRRCCREKSYEIKRLALSCKDSSPTHYTYNHINSCECQPDA